MKAIILAAGCGSRLRPYTDEKPKALVEFAGKPLFSRQISSLQAAGITDISVVSGYKPSGFDAFDIQQFNNPRWDETNMVYSLMCAKDILLAGEDVVIAYGDILFEPEKVAKLVESKADFAVTVDLNWLQLWQERGEDPLEDAESLRMDENGFLTDIGRKVKTVDEIEAQYMGLIYLSAKGAKEAVEFYENTQEGEDWLLGRSLGNCYMTDFIRGLMDLGKPFDAVTVEAGWLEFDTVSDMEKYTAWHEAGTLGKFLTLNWENKQ